MKRSVPFFVATAGGIVALDQWSKHWATENLAYRDMVHVIGDLVRFTYTRNPGIAFGLFAGHRFPFYAFSILASIAVIALFARHAIMSLPRQLSLACILGGAIGNLIDRVTTGEVVDFILLSWHGHDFYVFNVADIAVTTGVVLFALAWTTDGEAPAPAAVATAAPDAPAEESAHEPHAGSSGPGMGGESEGGPLAREGADRPVA